MESWWYVVSLEFVPLFLMFRSPVVIGSCHDGGAPSNDENLKRAEQTQNKLEWRRAGSRNDAVGCRMCVSFTF